MKKCTGEKGEDGLGVGSVASSRKPRMGEPIIAQRFAVVANWLRLFFERKTVKMGGNTSINVPVVSIDETAGFFFGK